MCAGSASAKIHFSKGRIVCVCIGETSAHPLLCTLARSMGWVRMPDAHASSGSQSYSLTQMTNFEATQYT